MAEFAKKKKGRLVLLALQYGDSVYLDTRVREGARQSH